MALEKWIAVAGLGLFIMFVGEMISIYHFMLEPSQESNFEFEFIFEADPKILQFISIGVAPASIMSAVAFILSQKYGSKQVGSMIVGGGIILLIGMAYCYTLVDKISDIYITEAVQIAPVVFMGISVPVIIFGALLFRLRERKPKKDYLT